MANSYQECKERLEEFYQTMTKEELIKRLLWSHSVSDVMRMGTLIKKEED